MNATTMEKNSTLLMQELQLKKTVVTFQFNVSGTHIGSNRDGRFDLSEFRKDTTLIVQGTQSHQHQAAFKAFVLNQQAPTILLCSGLYNH